jgi:hypothetical protein
MMNQEDLLKKTGNILKELQDQFDFLARDPKKLSELELELFLANAHFLTDHVQILKKVATTVKVHALPEHTNVNPKEIHAQSHVNVYDELFKPDIETPTFEFIVHDQLKQTASQPSTDADASPSQQIEPEEQEEIITSQDENILHANNPITEPTVGVMPNAGSNFADSATVKNLQTAPIESEEQPIILGAASPAANEQDEDEIGPEPFLVKREEAPIRQADPVYTQAAEPDITIKHQPNLNEQLASKSAVVNINLSESGKPIVTDLKTAINLNEKLLFIKDLFDGYNLAYAEAIDLLNKMPDFSTADKFLKANYAAKHQWTSKPGTVEQFYELLHQRFPK